MKGILYWFPRILSILFILFLSMFAMDVFGEPRWYIALPMHLIPSFILIILTTIAWKRERFGGILFLIYGIVMAIFNRAFIIAAPAFVIGVLYLIEDRQKN